MLRERACTSGVAPSRRNRRFPQVNTRLQKNSSQGIFALREAGTRHDIFIPVLPHSTGDKDAWNLPFSCYAGECSFSQIRMASDSYNVNAKPPVHGGKVAAMISVPLR
jgi:hypothetical protein